MTVIDREDPDLVSVFDELPLWSSPFGLELLEIVRMRRGMRVLDVGCGAGFPALELAGRLGSTSRVVGIDPWRGALARAGAKASRHGLTNVNLVCGAAEALPFPDATFDAVVSNNGLNNVADVGRALAECHRVLKPGGQLVATMNLPDTMNELYGPFAEILREREGEPGVARLRDHIAARRMPVAGTTTLLEAAGFGVDRITERSFTLRFVDGAALFEHPFIRLAFLEPWRAVPLPENVDAVMTELRDRLDTSAEPAGLRLSVPFACFDAHRPS